MLLHIQEVALVPLGPGSEGRRPWGRPSSRPITVPNPSVPCRSSSRSFVEQVPRMIGSMMATKPATYTCLRATVLFQPGVDQ